MSSESSLVKFAKPGGQREAQVSLHKEKKTGKKGLFGELYKVQIEYHGRVMDFYEKRFFKDDDAERAQKKYQKAKRAGLKVFPTYRLNKERNSILMTPADNDGQIEVTEGIPSGLEILSFDNFDDFIKQLFMQAHLAYQYDIGFGQDCLLYFYHPINRTIDFYIGDTDNIRTREEVLHSDVPYYPVFVRHMIEIINIQVQNLINDSIQDETKRNQYLEILHTEYKAIKNDLGIVK